MSRGAISGLASAHPLGERVPALYQEDGFTQALLAAFDEVLAPILVTLDNLDSYIEPSVVPEDVLHWLAGWVAVTVDARWPIDRRRALVAGATQLHRHRGTPSGLKKFLELMTGGEVEIEETGGTAWSVAAGTALPGRPGCAMKVRLKVADPTAVDQSWLNALVNAAKPAWVVHELELTGSGPGPGPAQPILGGP